MCKMFISGRIVYSFIMYQGVCINKYTKTYYIRQKIDTKYFLTTAFA